MKLRCAAYARYSSDRQSPASIDDQLRKCREFAEKNDWEVLEEHVYTDEALSGAGADRPGLARLLEAISRSQRAFDVLLMDDTSRLYRNLGDSMKFVERLNFIGIRVVSVSQGIDTQNEQSDVLMTVHSLVDSLYIKELAKKTHRGLEGCALKGLHTGGRCFGYDNKRDGESVRLSINEAEAAVVRRIFQMAAEGGSLKGIAKTLNREHLPPPRKRTGKVLATWYPSAIREMLRRDLYAGRLVWNRRRFVKKPGSNKRVSRERPKSEWLTQDKPELRIVDEPLWDRVQERLAVVAARYNFGNCPGLLHRASSSSYLLTGFMKCGSCGANLIIVSGRGKHNHPRYGCPQNFNRGACSNSVRERADFLEERLFSELQAAVLRPEAIEYTVQGFQRQLESSLAGLDSKLGRMRQRSEQLQEELRNLVSTVASCGHSPALVEAINSREQELREITRQLLGTESDSVSGEIGRIRQFAAGQLENVCQLLKSDVQKAKSKLEKHVTGIRLTPQMEGKKGHYVAEGEWNLLGGYGGGTVNPAGAHFRLVAGVGFEPTTFGL
jgi:site-specific DNA recombinase